MFSYVFMHGVEPLTYPGYYRYECGAHSGGGCERVRHDADPNTHLSFEQRARPEFDGCSDGSLQYVIQDNSREDFC